MKLLSRVLIALLSVVFIVNLSSCSKNKEVKPIRYKGSYNRDFNDLNSLHLLSAKKIGIKPPSTRDEIENIKAELKKIKSSQNIEVQELTHSIPYLVPKAADLLEKIGQNFNDSLKSLNAPQYKLVVTSVTRTNEDVTKLRKRNMNSSANSAHVYATTFDISWSRYVKSDDSATNLAPDQLKMVLASVLRDLKKEESCYVKHEKKQACFHITAR